MLLTCRQMAQRLGASTSTIRRWARVGLIPAPVTIGRSVRWCSDEVDVWERTLAATKSKKPRRRSRP